MSAEPVPHDGGDEHMRGVVPMQAQQAKLWRMAASSRYWALRCSLLSNVAMAFSLAWLLPSERLVPVFVYTNSMGVTDTAQSISALPPNVRVAAIEEAIWRYIRLREHYSPSEADESYKIVSAMSSPAVRTQYQGWANPKNNPKDAPSVKLGKDGAIRLWPISGRFVSKTEDYTSGVYVKRFCRVVIYPTGSPVAERLEVSVRYQLVQSVPVYDRVNFNHAALIVTEYPRPEPEGRRPGTIINVVGSDNPCA